MLQIQNVQVNTCDLSQAKESASSDATKLYKNKRKEKKIIASHPRSSGIFKIDCMNKDNYKSV